MNSIAEVLILLSPLTYGHTMTNALIVAALAGVGAYIVRRVLRGAPAGRGIDVGPLSTGWIAEHRREDLR